MRPEHHEWTLKLMRDGGDKAGFKLVLAFGPDEIGHQLVQNVPEHLAGHEIASDRDHGNKKYNGIELPVADVILGVSDQNDQIEESEKRDGPNKQKCKKKAPVGIVAKLPNEQLKVVV